jgi:hypothetical protein
LDSYFSVYESRDPSTINLEKKIKKLRLAHFAKAAGVMVAVTAIGVVIMTAHRVSFS